MFSGMFINFPAADREKDFITFFLSAFGNPWLSKPPIISNLWRSFSRSRLQNSDDFECLILYNNSILNTYISISSFGHISKQLPVTKCLHISMFILLNMTFKIIFSNCCLLRLKCAYNFFYILHQKTKFGLCLL